MAYLKPVETKYYKVDYDEIQQEKVYRIVEEFSILDVKTVDQLNNIMATHEGFETIPIKRSIDKNTFHPLLIVLLFKRIDDVTANTFMIRVPLELVKLDDSPLEYEIKNNVIVKKSSIENDLYKEGYVPK